jgi:hypothetical protein
MNQLATKVEEAARSTEEGVKSFIEPAQGTLRRATNKRHHVIFGRRGSGKSSLLRKAGADLTVDRRPIALVNLEAFKSHSYPDVLLSVLIATFTEFRNWLQTAAISPANKASFWQRLFGTAPTRASFNKRECGELSHRIGAQIHDLTQQLHSADSSDLVMRAADKSSEGESFGGSVKASIGSVGVDAQGNVSAQMEHSSERQESYRRSKIEFLHRHILDYQSIFREMARISNGDSFLFLDDLYQIRIPDQPDLIDYFHRIAKDHNLWLKVGTIRHRSNWYRHGNPPIGVKLGDDADEIDLDVTLEKYEIAKEFLLKILSKFAEDCGLRLDDFLTDGARDRLILASGGVARDFLAIFRRSIDVARERGVGHRGEKIGAEDVNVAAGEYESSKREDFKRDTAEDSLQLEAAFQAIRDFCLEGARTNCFLIDKDLQRSKAHLIHELVDLKMLHLVRSRVTVSARKGRIFEAYMLDLSQYSGERKRRTFEIVEFWKHDAVEKLRRAKMIYDPA